MGPRHSQICSYFCQICSRFRLKLLRSLEALKRNQIFIIRLFQDYFSALKFTKANLGKEELFSFREELIFPFHRVLGGKLSCITNCIALRI